LNSLPYRPQKCVASRAPRNIVLLRFFFGPFTSLSCAVLPYCSVPGGVLLGFLGKLAGPLTICCLFFYPGGSPGLFLCGLVRPNLFRTPRLYSYLKLRIPCCQPPHEFAQSDFLSNEIRPCTGRSRVPGSLVSIPSPLTGLTNGVGFQVFPVFKPHIWLPDDYYFFQLRKFICLRV